MLYMTHILGCVLFALAVVENRAGSRSWLAEYDDGRALDAPPDIQYVYAVSLSLQMLLTVGYSDMPPTNHSERVVSMVSLLLGAGVFAYVLTTIGSLVEVVDMEGAWREERLSEVKEYIRLRRLPLHLSLRVRRFFSEYLARRSRHDEKDLLAELPPALRREVYD